MPVLFLIFLYHGYYKGRRREMTFQFSENISKLRKAEEMTQERLAEVLGVSFGAVSKWERSSCLDRVCIGEQFQ